MSRHWNYQWLSRGTSHVENRGTSHVKRIEQGNFPCPNKEVELREEPEKTEGLIESNQSGSSSALNSPPALRQQGGRPTAKTTDARANSPKVRGNSRPPAKQEPAQPNPVKTVERPADGIKPKPRTKVMDKESPCSTTQPVPVQVLPRGSSGVFRALPGQDRLPPAQKRLPVQRHG